MKNTLFCFLVLWCIVLSPMRGQCVQKPADINPCTLIAPEKIFTAFPTLIKTEHQTMGSVSMCNYLDKFGIPALVISISKAVGQARDSLSMLGSGYTIEDISGLGDGAAFAVQQANPKFGLEEGVAALHIQKKSLSLSFSFFRIKIQQNTPEFEKVQFLAAEMLEKL